MNYIAKPRYKGNTIEINLPKEKYYGYSVECTYKFNKQVDKYSLSMWLKRKDLDEKFKIESEKIDKQYITSTKEKIVEDICRIVEFASSSDFFDRFIERFEYTCKCFDKGDEFYEKESKEKHD